MSRIVSSSNLAQLLPGTVLRVNRGFYDHVALLGEYAWGGERQVLSFGPTPKCLAEIPFSQFAGTDTVFSDGYLGQLAPAQVLARARQVGSERKYSWIGFNCEHFVRTAHATAVESPQLGRALFLAAGFFLLTSRA